MKKIVLIFSAVVMMVGISANLMAQDTHEAGDVFTYELDAMRIMDIEGTAPSLNLIKPDEAGEAVPDVSTDLSWINYTSIIDNGATNKITATLGGTGTMPTFTTLKVLAAADASGGDGNVGTASSQLSLTESAQDIITAIGSCWTGTGNTAGHKLTYTWGIDAGEYADAESISSSNDITVLYTIIATP